MLSHFNLIPERNGRTDRRTDGQICYINIARHMLTRDKKVMLFLLVQQMSARLFSLHSTSIFVI